MRPRSFIPPVVRLAAVALSLWLVVEASVCPGYAHAADVDPAAAQIAQTYAEWAKEALDQGRKVASEYVEMALAKDPENELAQQIRRTLRGEQTGGSDGEGLPATTGALPKGEVLLPSARQLLAPEDFTVVVDRSRANLRSAADTDAPIIGTMSQGDVLRVTGEMEGWYRVALPDGEGAWIVAALVKPYRPPADASSAAAKFAYPTRRDIPTPRAIPLNTAEDRFISYFLSIKRQIEYTWDYPQRAAEHGDCVIQFTILKNGRVRDIQLMHSSGFPALDREARKAVAGGAPYNPIPDRLATDELVVIGTFRCALGPPRLLIQ